MISIDPNAERAETSHRSKPTSVAFLALGGFVAISSSAGLVWFIYKIGSAVISRL